MTKTNRIALPLAALLFQISTTNVSAQATVQWIPATNGGIPRDASPQGRDEDGRAQYVCRAHHGKGLHIGKLASGFGGCNIGFGGREITVATYEVMSLPARKAATETSRSIVGMSGARSARQKLSETIPRNPDAGSSVAGAAVGTQRGFDEQGQPYVEERLTDGTIKRIQQNGVQVIRPDGTKQFIPNSYTKANAPLPSPPALPADPQHGRAWVDRHNNDLLGVIRKLVYEDTAAVDRFFERERQVAGNDVFKQIGYRTQVAEFLAQSR